MSKIPQFLKPGDKVAIVCPASYIKGTIDVAIQTLEKWGLEVMVGVTVTSQFHQFAGNDDLRAQDFQQALDDKDVKAVFAARGGYGTVRIIDKIDFTKFATHPKWVIGFSDITVLHSHIQKQFKTATIHGQMPKSFDDGTAESIESLRKALFGENVDIFYENTTITNRPGIASGKLIGGNLALLLSVLASKSDQKFDGKILFIEDVGEAFYSVDRMLRALKRAGKLKKLKGLIVGGFTEMKDSDPAFGFTVSQIVNDIVQEYDYPVAFEFPSGHIEDNRALILGKKVTLSVTTNTVNLTYND